MDQSQEEQHKNLYRYIDNEMTETERITFEKALEADPLLREELEFERYLLQLGSSAAGKIEQYFSPADAASASELDMLAMIAEARQNWEEEQKNTGSISTASPVVPVTIKRETPVLKITNGKNWAIAASVICILLSSMALLLFRAPEKPEVATGDQEKHDTILPPDTLHKPHNPQESLVKQQDDKNKPDNKLPVRKIAKTEQQQLFAENFVPDEAPEVTNSPITAALEDYANKDYKNAINGMDETVRGDDKNEKLNNFYRNYYKALSYLADNNPSKAIPEFEAAIGKSPTLLFKSKSIWYLALSNLRTGNLEKTDSLLTRLSAEGVGGFKQKASALKKKIE